MAAYVKFYLLDVANRRTVLRFRMKDVAFGAAGPDSTTIEALRDLIFGAALLSDLKVAGYGFEITSTMDYTKPSTGRLVGDKWQVAIEQGTNNADAFTFSIPGAVAAGDNLSGGHIANLSSSDWAALVTALEGTTWEITNPDPNVAASAGANIASAYLRTARLTLPRA